MFCYFFNKKGIAKGGKKYYIRASVKGEGSREGGDSQVARSSMSSRKSRKCQKMKKIS